MYIDHKCARMNNHSLSFSPINKLLFAVAVELVINFLNHDNFYVLSIYWNACISFIKETAAYRIPSAYNLMHSSVEHVSTLFSTNQLTTWILEKMRDQYWSLYFLYPPLQHKHISLREVFFEYWQSTNQNPWLSSSDVAGRHKRPYLINWDVSVGNQRRRLKFSPADRNLRVSPSHDGISSMVASHWTTLRAKVFQPSMRRLKTAN